MVVVVVICVEQLPLVRHYGVVDENRYHREIILETQDNSRLVRALSLDGRYCYCTDIARTS